jgi:hypothetical protein
MIWASFCSAHINYILSSVRYHQHPTLRALQATSLGDVIDGILRYLNLRS